jgi:pyruvate dehydrogenase E2 component (dihydrolipoamide acetyltransferase)
MPEVDFSQFGPVEEVELTKIKRVGAANLHRAWLHVPHVTQHDEADVTDLEAFRQTQAERAKKEGFKLTPLAFVLKACVAALREHPDFNSSLGPTGDAIIRKYYYHIGIAVDTPQGLVVPVLRDVDQKGVWALAQELAELSLRTRDRKLGPADLQGASFSVSNLGGLGGTAFTPIVNAPQVAILGVSKTQIKPQWTGESFEPRQMLPLSLSYDHRVIDGAAGARFTRRVAELLSDIRQLVL